MAIDCKAVLTVGDTLFAAGDEPSMRSGVSRHYYGSYHALKTWQAALPGMASLGPPGGGMHEQFYHQLRHPDKLCSNAQNIKSRTLAAHFLALKARRVAADYHLSQDLAAGDFVDQQLLAHQVVGDCSVP